MTSAPGFVRLALPHEARAIALVQRDVYREPAHPAAAVAGKLDVDEMAQVWERSIARPPKAENRVLVATEADRIVGFAALAPSSDPDASGRIGQVVAFAVDPIARRRGNGTRLVHAAVDTLRADGFQIATWWVLANDDALRSLLTAMGFASDGGHRELQSVDGSRTRLVRLSARIDEA